MRKGARTTQGEKLEIAQRICEAYASNDFTIESCCKANGISWATFWQWCNEKHGTDPEKVNEVNELYRKAQADKDLAYKSNLKQLARTALEKRVSGYDLEVEERTEEAIKLRDSEDDPDRFTLVRLKKTTRHIPADVRAIMYVLDNLDGVNFKSNADPKFDFSKLTEAEKEAALQKLANYINSQ